MKNRLLSMALIMLLATVVGCGTETNDKPNDFSDEKNRVVESGEAEETAPAIVESGEAEETGAAIDEPQEKVEELVAPEIAELNFEELSKHRFEFCSGAGAWAEIFTIEKDGSFTGEFYDSDMGSTGEGYDGGTRYYSAYSGHFTNLTKIDDYTYQMTLADISYENTVGKEEIADEVLYVYTDSYCLGGTDTFTIYLPGTSLDSLSKEIGSWIFYANDSETELTMIVIADETNGYGIYSYKRPEPLEEAQELLDTCKYFYDYYGEKLVEADTTMEMVEYTGNMYAIGDECLNDIWKLIQYNADEDAYGEILAKQREWIVQKEVAAEAAKAEYEGGSLATVNYNETLARLTLERCEELIEYLKEM